MNRRNAKVVMLQFKAMSLKELTTSSEKVNTPLEKSFELGSLLVVMIHIFG